MSQGLNKVMVIGWVDGELELRHTPNGRPVTSFTVSTSRTWETTDGDTHAQTEWFNVVAWGRLAQLCHDELYSGARVYLEGRLQTRGWEDKEGRKHFRTEVVVHDVIPLTD